MKKYNKFFLITPLLFCFSLFSFFSINCLNNNTIIAHAATEKAISNDDIEQAAQDFVKNYITSALKIESEYSMYPLYDVSESAADAKKKHETDLLYRSFRV